MHQEPKTEEQAPSIHIGHDDVKQPCSPRLPIFVVKRDQSVGNERHYFPPDQEEEGVGGGKHDCQAEEQEMEQEAEESNIPLALEFLQIAKRINRNCSCENRQGQAEESSQSVVVEAVGKQRNS